jgi:hypothetical protein
VVWDSAIDEICGTENPGKVTHVAAEEHVKTGALTELPATASSSPSATRRRPSCWPARSS